MAATLPLPASAKRPQPTFAGCQPNGCAAIRPATAHMTRLSAYSSMTCSPLWGYLAVSDIGRRDALDLIDGIADSGAPVMARRVHAHLHRFFRWAVGRGIIEANPIADLPKPGGETKRDRVLSDDELARVWKAAGDLGWPFGPATQLLILTGARREEIGALRWGEIDADGAQIKLEGSRTKAATLTHPTLHEHVGGADRHPAHW